MIRTFEAYSKFKKEKFIYEPLKVGDEFVFQYSNGKGRVKVKEINGSEVELMRSSWGQNGRDNWQTYDTIKFPLYRCQIMKDEGDLEKHNKTQSFNQDVHLISNALKLNKIKGGSLTNPQMTHWNMPVINELSKALETLTEIGEQYDTEDAKMPAGAHSFSSRSGKAISIHFNDVHRGDYYAGSTSFIIQIQVGGNLPYEKRRALLEVSKQLLSKYSFSSNLGNSRISDTDGTNWSSIMLTAPSKDSSYSIVPILANNYDNYMSERRRFKNDVKKYNL